MRETGAENDKRGLFFSKLRTEKGMTIAEAARKLAISESTLSSSRMICQARPISPSQMVARP